MYYDFDGRLAFSRGVREQCDIATLEVMIPRCSSVVKTDEISDRAGVDYVVTLWRGAELCVDAKAREVGCSRYWKHGPEVALESWSVRPDGKYSVLPSDSKPGWTLSTVNPVDLILFTFDPHDCEDVFLVSFPLLRIAFHDNYRPWRQRYMIGRQDSGRWESECVFVPIEEVFYGIERVSRGRLVIQNPAAAEAR